MARDLRDKVIVITGASSGIGYATAYACAQEGMNVTVAARRTDKLDELAQRLQALGRPALAVKCDVDRDDDVRALFEASWARWGRLDAAFANAGYGIVAPVLETADADIRAIFETNFFGTIRTLKAAAPDLRRTANGLRHALICSSSAAEISPPFYGVYAATKAAQDSVACAMRAELHGDITVSSVHPVGTKTGFFDAAQRQTADDPVLLNTPKLFMQTPEQVAQAVVKCLRRPKPEVWPQPLTRFGLALTTAFPRLQAYTIRRMIKKR